MVAKKKKNAIKKSAKKAIKKSVKSKTKKTTKRIVTKSARKPIKKAKKIIKKFKLRKSIQKSAAVLRAMKKPVVKKATFSSASKTSSTPSTTVTKTIAVQSVAPSRPFVQPTVKKSIMREQSNKTLSGKMDRSAASDMKFIETSDAPVSKKPTTLLGALEFTPYQQKPDETYMSEHQRDHFRKILDAWKQQLMQDVDLTVGHLKEDAVFYADPVDRASQEEGFNLELRTRDRERRLIKKIEQSLDLINTGEYGFCEDCGAEIGVRRLEARPTAVKCIDCKTFQEIREKQLGG